MEEGDPKPYEAQKEKFKNMDLLIEMGFLAVMLIARLIKEYKDKDKQ